MRKTYQVGDVVQCSFRGVPYPAKILDVKNSGPSASYRVHYLQWNKRWDEWVPMGRFSEAQESHVSSKKVAATSSLPIKAAIPRTSTPKAVAKKVATPLVKPTLAGTKSKSTPSTSETPKRTRALPSVTVQPKKSPVQTLVRRQPSPKKQIHRPPTVPTRTSETKRKSESARLIESAKAVKNLAKGNKDRLLSPNLQRLIEKDLVVYKNASGKRFFTLDEIREYCEGRNFRFVESDYDFLPPKQKSGGARNVGLKRSSPKLRIPIVSQRSPVSSRLSETKARRSVVVVRGRPRRSSPPVKTTSSALRRRSEKLKKAARSTPVRSSRRPMSTGPPANSSSKSSQLDDTDASAGRGRSTLRRGRSAASTDKVATVKPTKAPRATTPTARPSTPRRPALPSTGASSSSALWSFNDAPDVSSTGKRHRTPNKFYRTDTTDESESENNASLVATSAKRKRGKSSMGKAKRSPSKGDSPSSKRKRISVGVARKSKVPKKKAKQTTAKDVAVVESSPEVGGTSPKVAKKTPSVKLPPKKRGRKKKITEASLEQAVECVEIQAPLIGQGRPSSYNGSPIDERLPLVSAPSQQQKTFAGAGSRNDRFGSRKKTFSESSALSASSRMPDMTDTQLKGFALGLYQSRTSKILMHQQHTKSTGVSPPLVQKPRGISLSPSPRSPPLLGTAASRGHHQQRLGSPTIGPLKSPQQHLQFISQPPNAQQQMRFDQHGLPIITDAEIEEGLRSVDTLKLSGGRLFSSSVVDHSSGGGATAAAIGSPPPSRRRYGGSAAVRFRSGGNNRTLSGGSTSIFSPSSSSPDCRARGGRQTFLSATYGGGGGGKVGHGGGMTPYPRGIAGSFGSDGDSDGEWNVPYESRFSPANQQQSIYSNQLHRSLPFGGRGAALSAGSSLVLSGGAPSPLSPPAAAFQYLPPEVSGDHCYGRAAAALRHQHHSSSLSSSTTNSGSAARLGFTVTTSVSTTNRQQATSVRIQTAGQGGGDHFSSNNSMGQQQNRSSTAAPSLVNLSTGGSSPILLGGTGSPTFKNSNNHHHNQSPFFGVMTSSSGGPTTNHKPQAALFVTDSPSSSPNPSSTTNNILIQSDEQRQRTTSTSAVADSPTPPPASVPANQPAMGGGVTAGSLLMTTASSATSFPPYDSSSIMQHSTRSRLLAGAPIHQMPANIMDVEEDEEEDGNDFRSTIVPSSYIVGRQTPQPEQQETTANRIEQSPPIMSVIID